MRATILLTAVVCFAAWAAAAPLPPFTVVEASIPQMQAALRSGKLTSRELVRLYLERIATLRRPDQRRDHRQPAGARGGRRARPRAQGGEDPRPAARHTDRAQGQHPHHRHADHRRRAGLRRARAAVRRDAGRRNLATAGAIILAKTQMTELANWVAANRRCRTTTTRSNGYGFNPYDPRRDPREATVRRPAGAGHRRLELGHRHGGELLGGERRHRDLGLDPQSRQRQHARGGEADGRAASAGTASSRSPPTRTPRVRWRRR